MKRFERVAFILLSVASFLAAVVGKSKIDCGSTYRPVIVLLLGVLNVVYLSIGWLGHISLPRLEWNGIHTWGIPFLVGCTFSLLPLAQIFLFYPGMSFVYKVTCVFGALTALLVLIFLHDQKKKNLHAQRWRPLRVRLITALLLNSFGF